MGLKDGGWRTVLPRGFRPKVLQNFIFNITLSKIIQNQELRKIKGSESSIQQIMNGLLGTKDGDRGSLTIKDF